ncbi:DUF2802 domain-containing protein [Alteromonas halophila]|uniref:DUF2802 domain-containing protein n=1 Tax=Alteromonas halophila TaxID=516698 RepID=A0A918JDP0_9ALTE|nr:DUF2802 domain-containing protein [Alteromonas halophila]GGW73817.1 hypothetical protein GCM10007391_01890 [Alteromonas halophila]
MSSLSLVQLSLIAALAMLTVAGVLAIVLLHQRLRKTRQELENATISLVSLKEAVNALQHQQNEDQTRVVVVTRHLSTIEEKQTELETQIRDVKLQDPSMRLYQRAAELVKQGASMEEVMEACDIPRAEAEMLITVHRNQS